MKSQPQSVLPRTLTVRDARRRNLNKRVKIHSKRLRQSWPRIASFLVPQDIVVLGSTCRRLHRLLDNNRVWQTQYDQMLCQQMTRLLLPHLTTQFDQDLSTKEKLRRLLHARRVHDPTNALQLRLREAEHEVFRVELQKRKVRSVVWMNVPFVLALCCLSVWSYTTAVPKSDNSPATPAAQLRGTDDGFFQPGRVNPVKKFVLVTDLLLLVAVMILSVGDLAGKALYTVGVLVAIETVVMLAELVAWAAPLQVGHAVLILSILVFNGVLVAKKKKDYARELAAFLPSY